jgi:hypothetical protein
MSEEKKPTGIYEKLASVQQSLNVPKNRENKFGGYKYRACEDILAAVKPLLAENGLVLTISDAISMIGDRFYLVATARLSEIIDHPNIQSITTIGYARESLDKKGMDAAQITGAASSYARKYALNGLFAIDDEQDPDATNTHGKDKPPPKPVVKPFEKEPEYITEAQRSTIMDMVADTGSDVDKFLAFCGAKTFETIPAFVFSKAIAQLNKKKTGVNT